ncbi:MAG: sulfatase-like hydrolase/transferase [Hyphomonadaceae bacterium]|nr:sulfatase-like hydrolase/transferase [Hyphomonadaceae bacterium]
MKKLLIVLGVVVLLGAVGYVAFQQYKIYIPGLLSRLRDPIAEYAPVAWQTGPVEAELSADARPPNIIVIVADDLGYNDISFFGGGLVQTPNIDALAQQGAHAAVGYAANATCSPSRAAIMTGRYPTRFGFEFTAVPPVFARNLANSSGDGGPPVIFHGDRVEGLLPYPQMGLPPSEVTMAEMLRERGYHTVHIGKWHLGEADGLRPEDQGFAESLGMTAGGGLYLPIGDDNAVEARLPWDPIDRFLWANLPYAVQFNGGQRFAPNEYMTDYMTDNAVAAINANRNRPFFLYLAYTAPHTPFQATREDYDAIAGIEDHTTRVYAAMIRALDRGVGDVMRALRDNGLDRNTLVIFTSDNGGAWYAGIPGLNAPFRGWKATFFEGGLRVPFFVHWPAQIAAGTRIGGPAHHMDIYHTAAAASGAASQERGDGVDLLPFLRGQASAESERTLFWRSGGYRVVRRGDWKLQLSARPERVWLFNLADDPTEQNDLSEEQPDRVVALRALIEDYERELPAPLWPALIEGPIRIDPPLNTPWREDQEYIYWSN